MDPDSLTRPTPGSEPNDGELRHLPEPPPEVANTDWNAPSDAPAAVTLGWVVADVHLAVHTQLGGALPADLAAQLALELTRIALNSRLVETLLVRRG